VIPIHPRAVRPARIMFMLAAGATVLMRPNEATFMEQIVYAVRVGSWADPHGRGIGVHFDISQPPGAGIPTFGDLVKLTQRVLLDGHPATLELAGQP